MGTGFVGIFLPFDMILLTISLIDKFLKLNYKVVSQVSMTRIPSSGTAEMLFSIHVKFFIHSPFALNWLSKVPQEVMDEGSPARNKGKIFYTNAPWPHMQLNLQRTWSHSFLLGHKSLSLEGYLQLSYLLPLMS